MEDAIIVSNLQKIFRIPHEKRNTFFESLKGIYKKNGYEEFIALKNINFSIKKGEAVGIIGENGSGKSTLLKIIANILRPTSGLVKINGKITPFLELGVGFQPDLTAKENIHLYAAIMELSDKEIESKIEDILNFSELKKFEDTKLKNFSSGMQVRLAFATAIQTNPEILLLDEVLAVGDMEFQQKCLNVFQQYIKDKKTIVFVSHDLASVRRFCNKTLLLRHGEQIAFGETNEIIDKYVYHVGESNVEKKIKEGRKEKNILNKKIEIIGVKLIDKFGNESATFNSGDSLKIEIQYINKFDVKNPVFGIALYDETGNHLFGSTSRDSNLKLLEKTGSIDLTIKSIPFLSGKFFLTVAIANDSITEHFDWKDKEFSFNVVNKTKNGGIINIPLEWN